MKINARLLAAGAASALLVGGVAGASSAASATESGHAGADAAEFGVQNTYVTTWTSANIRDAPTTNSAIDRTVGANTRLEAECWVWGQTVTQHGVTNARWVYLESGWFDDEYIWAGALKGNETGGVTEYC